MNPNVGPIDFAVGVTESGLFNADVFGFFPRKLPGQAGSVSAGSTESDEIDPYALIEPDHRSL